MAYSDIEASEALVKLAVNKGDVAKTSADTGIPPTTLKRWAKNGPKKGVVLLLERAIERMLMQIPEKWSGNEWAIALGILMDKWLLVNGQPTARTEERVFNTLENLPDDDRERVIEEAERILARAASGSADPGA